MQQRDAADGGEKQAAAVPAGVGEGSWDLLGAVGATPQQEQFRAKVRSVAEEVRRTGALSADAPDWKAYLQSLPETERFHAGSVRKLKFSVQQGLKAGRCPFCWVLRESCFCSELPAIDTGVIDFGVVYHPNEFFRATSTGKLVAQCLGGEFLLYSYDNDRLRELVHHPDTYIFFPDETAVTFAQVQAPAASEAPAVPEAAAAAATAATEEPPAAPTTAEAAEAPTAPTRRIKVLVLDGTWGQARMLYSFLTKMNPRVKKLQLDMSIAKQHDSMFQALRKQSEEGRVSTFEACMLLAMEAGMNTEPLRDVMQLMVRYLTFEKHRPSPFGEVSAKRARESQEGHTRRCIESTGVPRMERKGISKTTDVELETWIQYLLEASKTQDPPIPVLRRCTWCDMWLCPSRMYEHVRGRLHCMMVAKIHLGRPASRYVLSAVPHTHSIPRCPPVPRPSKHAEQRAPCPRVPWNGQPWPPKRRPTTCTTALSRICRGWSEVTCWIPLSQGSVNGRRSR